MGNRIRNRSRVESIGKFSYTYYGLGSGGSGIDSNVISSGSQMCNDTVGFQQSDHELDITKKKWNVPRVSGEYDAVVGIRLAKVKVDNMRVMINNSSRLPSLPPVMWNYYATKAVAGANPWKPVTDVPLFLWELREFPGMLQELGDLLGGIRNPGQIIDGARKQALAWRFGWAPLFSDVEALAHLARVLDARNRMLRKPVKLARRLGNPSLPQAEGYGQLSYAGATPATAGTIYFNGKETAWFTANFSLVGKLPYAHPKVLTIPDLLGLTYPSAATLWNALPWTWLADYFLNIGDMLEAYRGNIPYKLSKLNVMCHQKYEGIYHPSYIRSGLTIKSSPRLVTEYKGRRQPLPILRTALRPYPLGDGRGIILGLITAGALKGLLR